MSTKPDWIAAESFSSEMQAVCSQILASVPPDLDARTAFAMASFLLAREHHQSIQLLFAHEKPSSAGALVRPLAEVSLRTGWFIHTADEEDIQDLSRIKEQMPLLGGLSPWLNSRHNGLLSSFTHGTRRALFNHFLEGEDRTLSNTSTLELATFFLAIACYEIAYSMGREEVLRRIMAACASLN